MPIPKDAFAKKMGDSARANHMRGCLACLRDNFKTIDSAGRHLLCFKWTGKISATVAPFLEARSNVLLVASRVRREHHFSKANTLRIQSIFGLTP